MTAGMCCSHSLLTLSTSAATMPVRSSRQIVALTTRGIPGERLHGKSKVMSIMEFFDNLVTSQ